MLCVIYLCACRMGYDLERFVGYVNEGLLCCVCRDVLERPLQAPCEHAYCSACISSWLVHHHSCPEDRQPLDVGSLKPLYRCVSVSAAVCLIVLHMQIPHRFFSLYSLASWMLPAHLSVIVFVCLMTGTCVMTWTVCRSVVWTQPRGVTWSAPWRACTHTRMSVSLPSYPAPTQVRLPTPTARPLISWVLLHLLFDPSCKIQLHKSNVTPECGGWATGESCCHGYCTN